MIRPRYLPAFDNPERANRGGWQQPPLLAYEPGKVADLEECITLIRDDEAPAAIVVDCRNERRQEQVIRAERNGISTWASWNDLGRKQSRSRDRKLTAVKYPIESCNLKRHRSEHLDDVKERLCRSAGRVRVDFEERQAHVCKLPEAAKLAISEVVP